MKILDGKKVSEDIKNEIKILVDQLKLKNKRPPHLAAILVGTDGASLTYVSSKVKACNQVGFKSSLFRFDDEISEKELLNHIEWPDQHLFHWRHYETTHDHHNKHVIGHYFY